MLFHFDFCFAQDVGHRARWDVNEGVGGGSVAAVLARVLRFSILPRKSPLKHHRFPREIILCVVRWYLRFPLSYQDVVDLLEERSISVDRATVYRWIEKFGPELTKQTEKHLRRASVGWHMDETYIRVGGK